MPTERQRRLRRGLRKSQKGNLTMEMPPDQLSEDTIPQELTSGAGAAVAAEEPAIKRLGNRRTSISSDQAQEPKKLPKPSFSLSMKTSPKRKRQQFASSKLSCASTGGKLKTESVSALQYQTYADKFRPSLNLNSDQQFPGLQKVSASLSKISQSNSATIKQYNPEASTTVVGDTLDDTVLERLWASWQDTSTPPGYFMKEERGQPITQQKNPLPKNVLGESQSIAHRCAVRIKPISTSPEGPATGMYVFPIRTVNLANIQIQFDIKVLNTPNGTTLTSRMFEAIAESPSGVPIPCVIWRHKDSPPTGIPPMMEKFQGMFKSRDEVGLYWLKVRFTLPLTLCDHTKSCGVLYDVSSILVSKNYFRDSMKVSGIAYQLPFEQPQPLENITRGLNGNAWGLACDKVTNRLYYTERMSNKVSCMDPTVGKILFQFRNEGVNSFSHPAGISCDEVHRRVFVCDKDNHRISSFTMDGEYIGSIGGQGFQNGKLNFPWDVAVSPRGTYFAVADSTNKRIQLYDRFGNFINSFSLFERNPFTYRCIFDSPRGIAFNHDGQLIYATDFSTENILEIPVDMGTYRKLVCEEGFLRRPQGLVVDEVGTVVVADSKNNCVRHLTAEGTHIGTVRFIGGNHLEQPMNIALMRGGFAAILDARGRINII